MRAHFSSTAVRNSLATAVIIAGSAFLGSPARASAMSRVNSASMSEYCCISGDGNFLCCGTAWCSADESSCTAHDEE